MKALRLPLALLFLGLLVAATFTHEQWLPAVAEALGFGGGRAERPSVADEPDPAGEAGRGPGAAGADAQNRNSGENDSDADRLEADAAARKAAGGDEAGGGAPGAGKGKGAADSSKSETDEKAVEETAKEAEEAPVDVETVEGQEINPNLSGYLQRAQSRVIRGFVYDKHEREAELWVSIYIDEAEAFELRAAKRQDHKKHGVIWHFRRDNPSELNDGEKHVVRAYVYRKDRHGRTELRWSPRNVDLGRYPRGKLEEATPEKGISGYAWDPDTVKKGPCQIVIRIDGETVKEMKADLKNEELKKRRIAPVAKCAFRMDWPEVLDDGLDHTVQVFALDSESKEEYELDGSPRLVMGRSGTANAAPVGRFEICNKAVLAGWTWDADAHNGPNDVEIWIDGTLYIQISAGSKRDTLVSSRVTPDPNHGFVLTTPGLLLDGKTHTVRIYGLNYPSGVKVELDGSPKQYKMEENTVPMGGFWRADENWLRGWAADPDLGTEACEIEIYIDGKLWKRQKADNYEEWLVGSGYAPNAEHGIRIKPPDFVKDGQKHEVQILAINYPDGPAKSLGTRTIGVNSIFAGFWTSDKLLDTRAAKGLYVRSVSPWFDAYHKGVKKGDVLLEYGGVVAGVKQVKDKEGKVTTPGTMTTDFRIWLNTKKKKNDLVKFKFWRDGETYEVEIKMGQLLGR